MFSVSRMTVNRAMQTIIAKGLLTSKRGYGTVVNSTVVEKKLTDLTSFTDDMINRGMSPITELLDFTSSAKGFENVQEKLGVSHDTIIYRFTRRRLDRVEPVAIDVTYVNSNVIGTIDVFYLEGSFYKYIEEVLAISISYSLFEIYPILANKKVALLLNVTQGIPLIRQDHITFTKDKVPFEYVETTYNPAKYKFSGVSCRNPK